jgi:hypothetical protein
MFDLEKAIKQWRKNLRKNEAMEDGYIEEIESHLREEIEGRIFFLVFSWPGLMDSVSARLADQT